MGQKRKQAGGAADGRAAQRAAGGQQDAAATPQSPRRQQQPQAPVPHRSPGHGRKPAAPRRLTPGARAAAGAPQQGAYGGAGPGAQGAHGFSQNGGAAALDAAGHSLEDVLNLPISSEGAFALPRSPIACAPLSLALAPATHSAPAPFPAGLSALLESESFQLELGDRIANAIPTLDELARAISLFHHLLHSSTCTMRTTPLSLCLAEKNRKWPA